MLRRTAGAVLLSLALVPAAAGGQNVVLDEGTFAVFMDGRRVGLETFTIRRSGTGQDARVIATADIRVDLTDGPLRMAPALEAVGPDLTVAAYQNKISGTQEEEIALSSSGGRLVARSRSQRGERVREYRATPATLVLDHWVAHQHFFLHSRLAAGEQQLGVVVPRAGRELQLRVADVSTETVSVGGRELSARHLRLEGGGETRHVWLDEDGRVLRVSYGDYRAERQEIPS